MKRFLIAAVAALSFGAPAMAQSYGGYGAQPYYGQQTYRGDAHRGGYDDPRYRQQSRVYDRGGDHRYRDRDYRGYHDHSARHGWREERRHERRDRYERRGRHGY